MTTRARVLGVLGLCRVCLVNPTHVEPPYFKVLTAHVSGVLGLRARARRRDSFHGETKARKEIHANTEKLNKPNTLNTTTNNPLNLLSFNRVGYVLGSLNGCWVVHEGATNDE